MKKVLVTGCSGYIGSHLCKMLEKEYDVYGLDIKDPQTKLKHFNKQDINRPINIEEEYDAVIHLAALVNVGESEYLPIQYYITNVNGTMNVINKIKTKNFILASTGAADLCISPYGVSKVASHRMVQLYREAYGLFACSGILFNHESPRRGDNFVTRKITKYIGQLINKQTNETLKLGNLQAMRDWGHAKDYVVAMFMMLQSDSPEDFVICTGKTWSVLDFARACFDHVDLDYKKYIEIDITHMVY